MQQVKALEAEWWCRQPHDQLILNAEVKIWVWTADRCPSLPLNVSIGATIFSTSTRIFSCVSFKNIQETTNNHKPHFPPLTLSMSCVFISHSLIHGSKIISTVIFLSFRTDRPGQTMQTQIRLLLEEQSDQGLHCLKFPLHLLDALL